MGLNEDFSKTMQEMAKGHTFTPGAYYNRDGDCIEFMAKEEAFYAERIDDLVTVYRSMNDQRIVGALIKGVSGFYSTILKKLPGFAIEIREGRVRLAALFRAHLWSNPAAQNQIAVRLYERLIESADETNAEAEFPIGVN